MERLQPPTEQDLFQSLCAATVRHACVVRQLANPSAQVPSIAELLRTAPRSMAEARSPNFHANSLCCESLRIATRLFNAPGFNNEETRTALRDAEWHFLGVIPLLRPDRRRQLEAAVAGVISGMQLGQKHLPLRAS